MTSVKKDVRTESCFPVYHTLVSLFADTVVVQMYVERVRCELNVRVVGGLVMLVIRCDGRSWTLSVNKTLGHVLVISRLVPDPRPGVGK